MKRQTLFLVFLSLALIFASAVSTNARVYSFTQLPYIGETYYVDTAYHQAWVTAINDLGQVVGTDQTDSVAGPRAFIWSEIQGIQFPSNTVLPGKPMEFQDINNNGEVVGYIFVNIFVIGFPAYVPVYWSQATGLKELPQPNGYSSGIVGRINEQGQITGMTYVGNVDSGIQRAVLWNAQHVPQILAPPIGINQNFASGINNKGDVIGVSFNSYLDYEAFLWKKTGGMGSLLPFSGDTMSMVSDINDKGDVVGVSLNADYASSRAVLWPKKGGVQDLGNIDPVSYHHCSAAAINNSGQIVGTVRADTYDSHRPFIWTKKEGMQDLNTLVIDLPEGVTLHNAYDINNLGQIIVYGFNTSTKKAVHGVLTPVGN